MRTIDTKQQTKNARLWHQKQHLIKTKTVMDALKKHPDGMTMRVLKEETGLGLGAIDSILRKNKKLVSIDYQVNEDRHLFIKIIKLKSRKKKDE